VQPSYIVAFEPGHTGPVGDGDVSVALEVVLVWLNDEELVDPLIMRTATFEFELTKVPPGGLR